VILYLLRHAKSSWPDPGLADHDRPLADRGRRAAPRMGAYLAAKAVLPSVVLCSSAKRAAETLDRVLRELPVRPTVHTARSLYLADPEELLDQIRETRDDAEALLLVGHNPGLEELALALVAKGDERARRRMESKFPTGALAEIHFDCARWHQVDFGRGELRDFRTPRELR
jgi:phosphohistidine phosphatase